MNAPKSTEILVPLALSNPVSGTSWEPFPFRSALRSRMRLEDRQHRRTARQSPEGIFEDSAELFAVVT